MRARWAVKGGSYAGLMPHRKSKVLLTVLHARIVAKTLYAPPPSDQAHLYERRFLDMEHNGTTIYRIPTWMPKAECEAWEESLFRPRWHGIGHA